WEGIFREVEAVLEWVASAEHSLSANEVEERVRSDQDNSQFSAQVSNAEGLSISSFCLAPSDRRTSQVSAQVLARRIFALWSMFVGNEGYQCCLDRRLGHRYSLSPTRHPLPTLARCA